MRIIEILVDWRKYKFDDQKRSGNHCKWEKKIKKASVKERQSDVYKCEPNENDFFFLVKSQMKWLIHYKRDCVKRQVITDSLAVHITRQSPSVIILLLFFGKHSNYFIIITITVIITTFEKYPNHIILILVAW